MFRDLRKTYTAAQQRLPAADSLAAQHDLLQCLMQAVNETTVYQRVLQLRYDQLEACAQQALALVGQYVNDQQNHTLINTFR